MRKTCIAIMLCCWSGLLVPAGAAAQSVYDVSCKNVRELRIISADASRWTHPPAARQLFLLDIQLWLEYRGELQELWTRTPHTPMRYSGEEYRHKDIRIRAGGAELRSAIPVWENACCGRIVLPYASEEEAFAAARRVCPERVPDRALLNGQ